MQRERGDGPVVCPQSVDAIPVFTQTHGRDPVRSASRAESAGGGVGWVVRLLGGDGRELGFRRVGAVHAEIPEFDDAVRTTENISGESGLGGDGQRR